MSPDAQRRAQVRFLEGGALAMATANASVAIAKDNAAVETRFMKYLRSGMTNDITIDSYSFP